MHRKAKEQQQSYYLPLSYEMVYFFRSESKFFFRERECEDEKNNSFPGDRMWKSEQRNSSENKNVKTMIDKFFLGKKV